VTTLPPFQSLIDDHGRALHRFLVATIGPGDADDCYQETWLAALRAYPEVRDASNLRGWLFTIGHRKAIDAARARKRRATPIAEPGELRPADTASDPAQGRSWLGGAEVWDAVAALPVKQRAALALRFIADCAYAEIGRAMQTSEDAARRSVHEALRKLRLEVSP